MSMAQLEVSVMGGEAVDLVFAMHQQCFDASSGEFWRRDHFRQTLDRSQAPVVVLSHRRDAGMLEPVGYAMIRFAVDEAEILSLAIVPCARGQGLAARLLDAVVDHCIGAKVQRLFLEVRMDNDAARQLYAKRGFSEVGIRKNYYRIPDGGHVDAITMALSIEDK